MPSFCTIIHSTKLVLRQVKHVANIQWKQWGSTSCISPKVSNIVIFKIVQYFLTVVYIGLLNAIIQLFKVLDDVILRNNYLGKNILSNSSCEIWDFYEKIDMFVGSCSTKMRTNRKELIHWLMRGLRIPGKRFLTIL